MAPMSLGWPTFPPTLARRAPDHERVRWEYQTDSHLAGLHWKEDTTRQNVPSMPRFPSIEQRHTVPKKAISCLHRSSGSLGLSEAWPQPAHTACKHRGMNEDLPLRSPPTNPVTHGGFSWHHNSSGFQSLGGPGASVPLERQE